MLVDKGSCSSSIQHGLAVQGNSMGGDPNILIRPKSIMISYCIFERDITFIFGCDISGSFYILFLSVLYCQMLSVL